MAVFPAAEDTGAMDVEVGQRAAAVVFVVDAHRPGLPGCQGRVAAAARLDGSLSSAEITYSSQRGAVEGADVQVQHGRGLLPKAGSRTEIQDWYCRGLSASCLSQRRTVEVEVDPAMDRSTTSRARSGHDQRDSGVRSRRVSDRPAP